MSANKIVDYITNIVAWNQSGEGVVRLVELF